MGTAPSSANRCLTRGVVERRIDLLVEEVDDGWWRLARSADTVERM